MTDTTKWAALCGLVLALTFGLGEISLRLAQWAFGGTSPTTLLPGYRDRRFQLSPFLVFGPRINWQIGGRPNPEFAYFNKQGFRTQGLVGTKPTAEIRIVAIGGSTTEDVWNEEGLHWPLWLERELRVITSADVRVYNTGMSAYTSAHTIVRLALDVLDYEPDFVIVMHNVNDLVVNYRAAIRGEPVDSHYLVAYGEKRMTGDVTEADIVISRLAHAVSRRLEALRQPDEIVPEGYDISAGLVHFTRNLRTIEALTTSRGSELILLTMPLCSSESVYRTVEFHGRRQFSAALPADFEAFKHDFGRYNGAVMSVAEGQAVTAVDMAALFGGDQEYFSDFVHYNSKGSRRFGELLADQIAPVIVRRSEQSAANDTVNKR